MVRRRSNKVHSVAPRAPSRDNPFDIYFHLQRVAVDDALREGPSERAIAALLDKAFDFADQLVQRWSAQAPVACSKGCSICCHVAVPTSMPELFSMIAGQRDALADSAMQRLSVALGDAVTRATGLSNRDRYRDRIPCALLDESGACSVYPDRPVACRTWLSSRVSECRSAFEARDPDRAVRMNSGVVAASNGIAFGLWTGLNEHGLDGRPIKLMDGALAVLGDTALLQRWCKSARMPDAIVDQEVLAGLRLVDHGTLAESVAFARSLR